MVGCGSTGAADYYYSVYRGDNPLLEIHDVDGLAGGTYTPHLEHRYMYGLATDQILASENSLGEVLWGLADNEGTIRDVVRSTTQAATVGAWSFEEASGSTINDASAYQNNGQLSASPPTRVTGLYGDALQFNGSNNSATIPASSSLNGIAGSFTVELCFKYNGAGTAGKACWTLLNKNATGEGYNTPFHLYINASDKHVYARVGNNSTEYYLVSAAAVDDGQYHQVDLVYDDVGRTYKLYLDGQLNYTKDSLLDGWTAAQNTDPVTLGYWSAYGDYFNGILDEVQILTRALSADEISQSRVNHRKLDSFGNVTEYNASNVVVTDGPLAGDFPFAFTGKSYDVSVGLYYYSARWYDSLTGRFVSADPAGLSADANLYRYVGNDPLNNTDPTGLCVSKLWNGITSAAANFSRAAQPYLSSAYNAYSTAWMYAQIGAAGPLSDADLAQSWSHENSYNAGYSGYSLSGFDSGITGGGGLSGGSDYALAAPMPSMPSATSQMPPMCTGLVNGGTGVILSGAGGTKVAPTGTDRYMVDAWAFEDDFHVGEWIGNTVAAPAVLPFIEADRASQVWSNARATGYGYGGSVYLAGGVVAGDLTGVTGISYALPNAGSDVVTGQSYSWSQRAVNAGLGAVQLGTIAVGGAKLYTKSTSPSMAPSATRQTFATGSEWYDYYAGKYGAQNVDWVSGSGRTVTWPSELPMPLTTQMFKVPPPSRSSTFVSELESVAGPRPADAIGHHVQPLGLQGVDDGMVNGVWVSRPASQSGHGLLNRTLNRVPYGTEIRIKPGT